MCNPCLDHLCYLCLDTAQEPRPTKSVVLPPSAEPAFHHLDRPVQVRAGVSQTKEPGLELRWREIDAGT
jgi:hypothetical protein